MPFSVVLTDRRMCCSGSGHLAPGFRPLPLVFPDVVGRTLIVPSPVIAEVVHHMLKLSAAIHGGPHRLGPKAAENEDLFLVNP